MKKSIFVVLATLVAMCQFGCGWKALHDVAVHLLGLGWTADMLNLIPQRKSKRLVMAEQKKIGQESKLSVTLLLIAL